MTRRHPPKNLAASVRARLAALARERGEDFQWVLTRYGLERLLYRLSRSVHREDFVLKGAMLFQVWSEEPHRPTRDLDLLGRGPNTLERFTTIFSDICTQPVEEDGLRFLVDRIRGEEIRGHQENGGLRMLFEARLANIRIPVQIDIGFGDTITPAPVKIEFPTLLDLPSPVLHAYSRETVIAEKLQAMVILGMINTRMKDFLDLWVLCRDSEFQGAVLAEAIRATFERRRTELPHGVPIALTEEFARDAGKQAQWRGFLQRGKLSVGDAGFVDVITTLRGFLLPPVQALRNAEAFGAFWPAGGFWTDREGDDEQRHDG